MSDEVLVWLFVWSAYGPADATAIPKPHHLLPRLNPDWFYLSRTGLPTFVLEKRPLNGCSTSEGEGEEGKERGEEFVLCPRKKRKVGV